MDSLERSTRASKIAGSSTENSLVQMRKMNCESDVQIYGISHAIFSCKYMQIIAHNSYLVKVAHARSKMQEEYNANAFDYMLMQTHFTCNSQ